MRRLLFVLMVMAAAAGCGFGLSDDNGQPNPGLYWKWVCGDGNPPDGDAACPPADASTDDGGPDGGATDNDSP